MSHLSPRVALGLVVGLALVGCSDGDDGDGAESRTTGEADCASIEASDELTSESLEMRCDPETGAMVVTMDCTTGVYIHLLRPEGDLEGIVGRSRWRAAEPRDPHTGRTPFAFEACREQ